MKGLKLIIVGSILLNHAALADDTNETAVIHSREVVTNSFTILMADKSRLPSAPGTITVTGAAETTLLTNFFTLGWDDYWPDAYFNEPLFQGPAFGPPDTQGAVGTNHVLTMLNTEVRVQNRDGTTNGGYRTSLMLWWTSSNTGPFRRVFDPRTSYNAYPLTFIELSIDDTP